MDVRMTLLWTWGITRAGLGWTGGAAVYYLTSLMYNYHWTAQPLSQVSQCSGVKFTFIVQ